MPVSDKEHFDALRAADQRAIDLLAKANSDRIKSSLLFWSLMVAIASIVVAIAAVLNGHH